jgi:hypothetical protein
MNCRQVRGLFSSRLDCELDREDASRFEQHLQDCGACASQWTAFSRTVQLVRSLPPVAPDPAFVGRVLDRVRGYEAGHTEVVTGSAGWFTVRIRTFRSLMSEFPWPSVLFPARLAGAVALGAMLGFVVTEKVWNPGMGIPPLASKTEGPALTSHLDDAQAVAQNVMRNRVGSSSRPFADLVPELASIPARTADSTGPGGQFAVPGSPADLQSRQVDLSVLGGRPQVTF